MSQKQLFVSSPVQIAMLQKVIIPEMVSGFWKDHRPAGHGKQWEDVELVVTSNTQVGPSNFKVPRLYNFVNPEFLEQCEDMLIAAAQEVDANADKKQVRRLLIELSRTVGGRLTDLTEAPTKANRGTNVADGREVGNILTSGKGLGSPEWLESAKLLIAAMEDIGASVKIGRLYVNLERGARKARIFVNGANALIVEQGGGEVIASAETQEQVASLIERAKIELTTVNVRKTVVKQSKDGVTTTTTPGGATVRRAAVSRVTPSAAALAAANPFGAPVAQTEEVQSDVAAETTAETTAE